ncbi:LBF_2804 family protein [Polyangium jinanense]|uniref:Uncharacterized protein n=1 Tax=Polyangium jinanense TaxID=2829994 RepID=A0A9X3WZT7_9BACT|nr:hypothetical protein [Polyangium jinanense]MDC3952587.1 hypothetical protein [Polyangium jinanense]MDC3980215.1 hypothetical protein [Polyangium jinanense]
MVSASGTDPAANVEAKAPLLERLGVLYFRRLSASLPRVAAADAVSVLNAEERRHLSVVVRGAVIRACVAGAVSAALAAGAEVLAERLFGAEHASVGAAARYWALVGGVTIVASVAEILYLYWDSLRAVHQLSRAAGLDPFATEASGDGTAVATALARAALELPNPTERVFGVDPRREASKIKLAVASLLYKLKVSVTNFAVKVLVRRLAGRALVRTWLPFVAVPGTAAWNGIVCWIVLREAKIRVMGPSAARELVGAIFDQGIALSAEGRLALVRAVASAIVRTEDLHPNLHAVLVEVLRRVDDPLPEGIDDSRVFLDVLSRLPHAEQRMALQVLHAAAIIDGRFTSAEKRLLREAQAACGRTPDVKPAERLRRAFVVGAGSLDEQIRALL